MPFGLFSKKSQNPKKNDGKKGVNGFVSLKTLVADFEAAESRPMWSNSHEQVYNTHRQNIDKTIDKILTEKDNNSDPVFSV